MADFEARVLAKLDLSNLNSELARLSNSNNTIRFQPQLDTGAITRQIDQIEQRLRSLGNIRINLGGGGGGGSRGSSSSGWDWGNARNYTTQYQQLYGILRQIGSLRVKIGGLDASANSNQIQVLQTRLEGLNRAFEITRLQSQQSLSADQFVALGSVINDTESQLTELASVMQDTRQRMADSVQMKIDNGSIEASISSVTAQYERLSNTGHSSLTSIKADIEELGNIQRELGESSSSEQLIQNYERFEHTLKRVKNGISTVSSESKMMATSLQIGQLDNRMSQWLTNNSRASKEYGAAIANLRSRLAELGASGTATASDLKAIDNEFKQITVDATAAGLTGKSFMDSIKATAQQMSGFISVASVMATTVRLFKNMSKEVLAVDTSMTGLYRVTDLSSEQYKQMYTDMVGSAKKYGATLTEIIDGTTSWVKLGFDPEISKDLANITAMYQHVTDLDTETATKNLITAYKGFERTLLEQNNGDVVAAVTSVSDIYDKLGNEFAESAADVGDGLSKSAAVLQQSGASIQEAAGMFTGIQEVLQDSGKAGNTLKIMALRIRGMKGELEELGEEVDDRIDSVSKIQTQILNLTHGKVNIFDDKNNFRNITDILRDLSAVQSELSDTESAELLELIAGKNRSIGVQALLNNWSQVEKAIDAANNASGTASKEQDKYMQSLQGKINAFKTSWSALANTVISSDFLKGAVDSATTLLSLLDSIVGKLGTIPTIIGAIAAAMSIKNGAGWTD